MHKTKKSAFLIFLVTFPFYLSGSGALSTIANTATGKAVSSLASNLKTPVLLLATGTGAALAVLISDSNIPISAQPVPLPVDQIVVGSSYALGEQIANTLIQETPESTTWVKPLVESGFLVGMGMLVAASATGRYIPTTGQWNIMLGSAIKSATQLVQEESVKNKIEELKNKAINMGAVYLQPLGKAHEFMVENQVYKIAAFAAAGLTAAALYTYASDTEGLKQFAGSAVDLALKFQPASMYELGYRATNNLIESGKKGLQWLGSWLPTVSEDFNPG